MNRCMTSAHTRTLFATLAIFVLASCDGGAYRQNLRKNFEANDGDFRSIAIATFKLIDASGIIKTIVVPADIDPRARAALKAVAPLISSAQIPASHNVLLPAGYFAVQSFTVEDGTAMIEGQLGPVTQTMTAANMPDCGKNYTVAFYLEGGDWVSHSYKIGTCAESRHWVPVDAAAQQP